MAEIEDKKGIWKSSKILGRRTLLEHEQLINIFLVLLFGALALWAELGRNTEYQLSICMFFLLFAFVGILQILIHVKVKRYKKTRIDDLEDELKNTTRRFQDMLNQERRMALEKCLQEMTSGLKYTMQERICVYSHIDNKDIFECTARHSLHIEHNKFADNREYTVKTGIIGHVWSQGKHNGEVRDSEFPDAAIDFPAYKTYVKRVYKIPKGTVEKFRMRSVDLYAEVIRDVKENQVAVIVFESQRKEFIDVLKIEEVYNEHMKNRIEELLSKLHGSEDMETNNG